MSAWPRGSLTSSRRTWSSRSQRVAALVEDRRARGALDTAGHDAERLAPRVVVDRSDLHTGRTLEGVDER